MPAFPLQLLQEASALAAIAMVVGLICLVCP